MLKSKLIRFMLPLALLFSNSSENSIAGSKPRNAANAESGTLEKMIVANGNVAMDVDLSRLNGFAPGKLERLNFAVAPGSLFTIAVFNDALRGPQGGSIGLIPQNSAALPAAMTTSLGRLVIEKIVSSEAFDLVVRDGKTGFNFFNIEGNIYNYDARTKSLGIEDGRLLISTEFAAAMGRPVDAGAVAGKISMGGAMQPIEIQTIVNGAVQSAIMPPVNHVPDNGTNPGPDVIVGDVISAQQFGSQSGTQVGIGIGTSSCNAGTVDLDWFALPNTDHPVIPQNLYRMSGGASGNDRFEQIGQSWLKHAFTALTENVCGFGCNGVGGSHLGSGCSDPYTASLNASQSGLGSRGWVNPFTGAYPSTANDHSGHSHTGPSHRVLVEVNDLNTTLNPGATYFAEAQYVTPHEYVWCQSHPHECNMYNNVSYRQVNVTGTASPFGFSNAASTVRSRPAILAWTGAAVSQIEPAPGIDGFGLIGYKVTGPVAGVWHYEYAIYNENLDRSIQSFSVPLGCNTITNIGFHAPPQHPGYQNDGTQNSAGYSGTAWNTTVNSGLVIWNSETMGQNANANAIRWGTLYNFRFDSTSPPQFRYGTVSFFKTGSPVPVPVQAPAPTATCPTTGNAR
jgi:hypothetical protein